MFQGLAGTTLMFRGPGRGAREGGPGTTLMLQVARNDLDVPERRSAPRTSFRFDPSTKFATGRRTADATAQTHVQMALLGRCRDGQVPTRRESAPVSERCGHSGAMERSTR
jgi:hypothetical protein